MIEKKTDSEFLVKGILDFDNVSVVLAQAYACIAEKTGEVIFNFAGLQQSNSAGLALLTALLRYAKQQHCVVQFMNIPGKLWEAAKTSNLDEILPCV
jgi:ABC-type transporter Mla MlaB component